MKFRRRRAMIIGAALAAAVAGAHGATAQQAGQVSAAPAVGKSAFCIEVEAVYSQLLAPPGIRKGIDALTTSNYRNSAAERIVTMAMAARCDLGPLLGLEVKRMREVMAAPPTTVDVNGLVQR